MKHLDLSIIEDLKEVMEDEYVTLLNTYIDDSIQRIELIRAAVASGIGDQVRDAAHALKGSSSNIGAAQLSQLCKKLEDCGRNEELDSADDLLPAIVAERDLVEQLLRESISDA